jgi:UDP-glucose 4-epimerase
VRVLVTGGSGFIGRNLVRRLGESGHAVRVADLVPFPGEVDCVVGDLREPEVVARAIGDGVDGVVHLAALTSVLKSVSEPDAVYRTNVLATELLLERCREVGVRRFVLASTNAVVGDVGRQPIDESTPLHPLTPYGATKAAGEMLLSAYAASYGFTAVSLRFTNVYGIGMQAKDSIVARMMRAALAGGTISIYGDGTQVRDYLYVTDATAALERAIGLEPGQLIVLTIGSGESFSVNEVYEMVVEVTGRPIGKQHVDPKPGEMPAVIVDITKAKGSGFAPQYDLRAGLQATWEDFLAKS